MLAAHYLDLRSLHIGCVAVSGSLFTVRGLMRLGNVPLANHKALRIASMLIDTLLLSAAILLMSVIHRYPFVDGWLTAKLILLAVYIALGSIALKRARTRRGRLLAFTAALLIFGTIISVAVTHQPLGWLMLIR